MRGWLAVRGIDAEVLRWDDAKPSTGLQAAARDARLGLLTARTRALGAGALCLAHHIEDQAETLVMRLGRDSGLDGLAGIRGRQTLDGVPVLRPLLTCDPLRLRLLCLQAAQRWVEDPSNRDRRFERVRLRGEAGARAAVGLDASRLSRAADTFGRLRDWSENALTRFWADHGYLDRSGYALIDAAAAASLPDPLRAKLFADLLRAIGGTAYPLRRTRLERFLAALSDGGPRKRITAGGCLVWRRKDGRLAVCREAPRHPSPTLLHPHKRLRWDGRFDISWGGDAPVWVHMLTGRGIRQMRCLTGEPLPGTAAPALLASLPAVTDLDGRLKTHHLPVSRTREWAMDDGLLRIAFRPSVAWIAISVVGSGDDRNAAKD